MIEWGHHRHLSVRWPEVSGASTRRGGTERLRALLPLIGSGVFVVALAAFWVSVHLAAAMDGASAPPKNPMKLVLELVSGQTPWPRLGFVVLAGIVVLLSGGCFGFYLLLRKLRGARKRGDRAGRLMGRGDEIEALTAQTQQKTAQRLGVQGSFGSRIATTVSTGQVLHQGVEDVSVDIWGPRQGKTSCRVIPAIVDAPGAVFTTSNKRDIVDATRGVREAMGPVWIFDPQQIVGEEPTWWWNPLSYIKNGLDAEELAGVLFAVAAGPDTQTDAFFTPAGKALLANFILAAALDDLPMTQIYTWSTRQTKDDAAAILDRHGYPFHAAAVRADVAAPEEQRGGVFATVRGTINFLINGEAQPWFTPRPGPDGIDHRPHFSVDDFVRGSGTVYCMSVEGKGSTAGLVTAMTIAISDAAERWAARNAGGRLPIPLVMPLDETANVCVWQQLPKKYSHYGSKGINVLMFLQSWEQGEQTWGEKGMSMLWGASTVRVVGSGVSSVKFLDDLSRIIGDYDAPHTSRSTGRGQADSFSYSTQRERIMEVSDLAAMPKGRAIVLGAGTRPALCRTLPWMTGQHSAAVRASILRYDPVGELTMSEAAKSMLEVASFEKAALPAGPGR